MLVNISVSKRLGGGFALVTLTFVALLIFVALAFHAEHSTTKLLLSNFIPGTSTLYSSDRDLQQALVAERTLIATDPASDKIPTLLDEHAETDSRRISETVT